MRGIMTSNRMGCRPRCILEVSISVSNLMPAATGGKLSSISSQVTWTCLGCWRTRHFSVFWTIWSMRSPKPLPAVAWTAELGKTWFRKLFLQGEFGCGGQTYPCECLWGIVWDFLWDWGFIWGENQVQLGVICIAVIWKIMQADNLAWGGWML